MPKIKAAVCHAFGEPLTIEEVNLRAPEAGEVEVKLAACAVCFSDISYLDGGFGGSLPAVYGHEAAGHVSAAPAGSRYTIGDAVLVTLIRACGHCSPCATGAPTQCADPGAAAPLTTLDGDPVLAAMNCGAFAERVVVDESQLAPVPRDMPLDAASLLSCGVITGLGAAVNTAGVRPGDHVVVIGAGGVGLNAIQGARIAGAARIWAVDMVPEKLDVAREFGATDVALASDPAPWDAMTRKADHVLVSVGSVPAIETAVQYLAPHGTVYLVGLPHVGAEATYDPVNYGYYGQAIKGTRMGDAVLARDIPWLVDLYEQGRLKLDELITARYPLDQINEAIASTRSGAARRNVIVFDT